LIDFAAAIFQKNQNELRQFFKASDQLTSDSRSPLLEYTVPVVFRLQYACGLRPQEVRKLKRIDFNFNNRTIYISESKHYKDRLLAVNDDIIKLCKKYDSIAETINPGRTYFFQSPTGDAYSHGWLTATFHKCWELSKNANDRGSCVPYDLRNTHLNKIRTFFKIA